MLFKNWKWLFENTNQTPQKLVNNITNWVVDIGATKHICLSKELFLNYEEVIDEENVYLGDSGTARVAGKGKVLLKFTSGKSLALHSVVHVPNMCRNLECVWIETIHSCVFNFRRFPFFSFQLQLLTQSSVNSALKMGLTVLFTHLKIILLQYFQFSVFNFSKINSIQTDP